MMHKLLKLWILIVLSLFSFVELTDLDNMTVARLHPACIHVNWMTFGLDVDKDFSLIITAHVNVFSGSGRPQLQDSVFVFASF